MEADRYDERSDSPSLPGRGDDRRRRGLANSGRGRRPSLNLELNGAQASDKGCRLTFVVTNNLGAELTKAAFEIALFNDAGVVDRLTVLDFNELPEGKTKVARFDLAGTNCAKISRVLVNTATECAGPGVDPRLACASSSRRRNPASPSACESDDAGARTSLCTGTAGLAARRDGA